MDSELHTVIGLHVGYEGILRRTAHLIPRQAIMLFGVDTVLVKRPDVVVEQGQIDEVEQWVRRDELSGREIETPGGTRLGTLGDVVLNDFSRLLGFTLDRTYVDSPVAHSGAISRVVVLEPGDEDRPMFIDLEQAEQEEFSVS